jgi:hypothetical protein
VTFTLYPGYRSRLSDKYQKSSSICIDVDYLDIDNVFPFYIFLIQDFQFHGLKFIKTKVSVYSKENYNFSMKIIEIHISRCIEIKNATFESIMLRTLGSMKDGKITWS